ncbi:transcriptional regulator [Streptomyces sp. SID14515]|uniref:transcriptional regulator n=1 Tax=Streptomyces sp. SID14515 TaxID=2706074 RepID=UPI0031BA4FFC
MEQERANETRAETLHILARSLRTTTSYLLGDRGDEETTPDERWEGVRQAIQAPPVIAEGLEEPPTVEGVTAALGDTEPLRRADQFAATARLLPSLIRDADALGPEGREVRVRVLQLAGWLMIQTRQFDVAELALDRAMDDGSNLSQWGATVNSRCWMLLRQGQLGKARELATHWADEMEPRRISRATPGELCAWGWMLLRVSAAAVRDNRPGEAADAMKLARAAASVLGTERAHHADGMRTFGPTTIVLKSAENESIRRRPDKVLDLAKQVPIGGVLPSTNNRNRHALDVADALVATRKYAEAVGVLQGIHDASPEWLPNQRYARDILGRVVERRRSLSPEIRNLAEVVGLAV